MMTGNPLQLNNVASASTGASFLNGQSENSFNVRSLENRSFNKGDNSQDLRSHLGPLSQSGLESRSFGGDNSLNLRSHLSPLSQSGMDGIRSQGDNSGILRSQQAGFTPNLNTLNSGAPSLSFDKAPLPIYPTVSADQIANAEEIVQVNNGLPQLAFEQSPEEEFTASIEAGLLATHLPQIPGIVGSPSLSSPDKMGFMNQLLEQLINAEQASQFIDGIFSFMGIAAPLTQGQMKLLQDGRIL